MRVQIFGFVPIAKKLQGSSGFRPEKACRNIFLVGFRASGGRWAGGFARFYAEGRVELKFLGIELCG